MQFIQIHVLPFVGGHGDFTVYTNPRSSAAKVQEGFEYVRYIKTHIRVFSLGHALECQSLILISYGGLGGQSLNTHIRQGPILIN